MEVAEWIGFGVGIVVMLVGVAGTVIPAVPGLPLIWLTMLGFGVLEQFQRIDASFLGITFVVLVAAEVADYVTRARGASRHGAGRAGSWGAVLGAIVGLFFLPVGLVLGPFLGAFGAELLAGRTVSDSMRAGWGGLIGTLGSIAIKLVVAFGMMIAFIIKVV